MIRKNLPGSMIRFTIITLISLSCTKNTLNTDVNELVVVRENNQLEYVLPAPRLEGKISVEQAIYTRKSHREYLSSAISAEDLSQIVWAAYGMVGKRPNSYDPNKSYHTVPSAGACFPLEIYVLVQNVSGIDTGVYKYQPLTHSLLQTCKSNLKEELSQAANNQKMIATAPACLLYSADYSKTTRQFGLRGAERYVCMDLGHSAQNVYLQMYIYKPKRCTWEPVLLDRLTINRYKRLCNCPITKQRFV